MKSVKAPLVLSFFALMTLLIGCSTPATRDDQLARQVVDCLYAGSLAPVHDRLGTKLQVPVQAAAAVSGGPALKQKFGAVKTVKRSTNTFDSGGEHGISRKTWTVTAENGTFDIVLYFDEDGQLDDLSVNTGGAASAAPVTQ